MYDRAILSFRKLLLFSLFFGFSSNSDAHNARETHAVIELNDSILNVELDVTWSFNRSLESLDTSALYEDIIQVVTDYLNKTFIVSNGEEQFRINSLAIEDGVHSHSALLRFNYLINEAGDISISNRVSFESSNKQANYYQLKKDGEFIEKGKFTVEEDTISIKLNSTQNDEIALIIILLASGLFIFFLVLKFSKQ